MKNSKLTGWSNVFKFTYAQSMKSKASIITLVIMCLIALISFPVMSFIDGAGKNKKSEIENIYIFENNIYIADGVSKVIMSDEAYENTSVKVLENSSKEISDTDVYTENTNNELEKYKKDILGIENSKDVLVEIYCVNDEKDDNYGINYRIYYSNTGALESSEADNLAGFLEQKGDLTKYISAGVDELMAEVLSQNISYNIYAMDENGNIVSDGITGAQYSLNYVLLMITLLSISFAGSAVATQIVTEKSTKVVEYILTSVKPMAIITGKVFASLAVVFTILGAVIVSFIASGFVNGVMFAVDGGEFMMPEIITNFFNSEVVSNANIVTVIISVIIFIEGFVFYGFLAGVSGAMVSKIEELSEGTKLFTFAMLIGAYLTIALIMSSTGGDGWGDLNYLVYFLPLSAPFIVPSYMLFGIVTPLTGIIVIIINFVFVLGLIWLVSRIYEQLIYHNGSPLKIKDLFQLGKSKGGNK
ncbi:MAG: ABC transporter permease [Lachnospiraceae bacterium]|nr:ABC transporter permease [Lachnospiraceae bacterium]